MPLVSAGIMAGTSALGSIIGGSQSSDALEAAMAQSTEFTNQAIEALEAVGIPSVEAQQIALETPDLVFDYVPELAQSFPEVASAYEEITTDEDLYNTQMSALGDLEELSQMGLTPSDIAELESIQRDTASQQQSMDATILQDMEQRGLGGSGAELASRLAASQSATQSAAESAQDTAATAFDAKQAAIESLLSNTTDISAQQYSQDATTASALDSIAQFNAENTAATQQSNLDAINEAALTEQTYAQELENTAAETANTEETYNKELIQQNYENELGQAEDLANIYSGQASTAMSSGTTDAQNTSDMWSGISSAVGGLGSAAASSGLFTGSG